jgi:ubiquinone/menaquinone biosynthesis C-methylase UbiE
MATTVGTGKSAMKSEVETWIEEAGEKFLKDIGIKSGQRILDFGCGSGNYAIPAAKIVGEEGLVYALDKDKRSLDQLMRKAESMGLKNIIRLDTSNESGTGLDDESLDVVLLYDVLHHYYFPRAEARRQLLRESYRVLRPSGLLSFYPTHLQSYMEPTLDDVEREIQEANFYLECEYSGTLVVHDNNLEKGQVMNFRKGNKRTGC